MPKLKPHEKRVFLKFSEPEDLALLERLEKDAKKQRYPLSTYVMLVLLQAYPVSGTTPENPQV
jgi:hypothetical protein